MVETKVEAPIRLFHILDSIAEKHGISLTEWAGKIWPKKPGRRSNFQSRLSEQRAVWGLVQAGAPQDKACKDIAGGRRWTIGFCLQTTKALKELIGGIEVNKDLFDAALREDDDMTSLFLLILAHDTKDARKRARSMLITNLKAEDAEKN